MGGPGRSSAAVRGPTARSGAGGAAVPRPVVVVVDDDPEICGLLAEALESELGLRVEVAGDGWEALAGVRAERPALVLLDLLMPGMDGVTFCRRVRADPALVGVPVAAITALPGAEGRRRAQAAGCVACLPKPFDLPQLLAVVRRLVGAGASVPPG